MAWINIEDWFAQLANEVAVASSITFTVLSNISIVFVGKKMKRKSSKRKCNQNKPTKNYSQRCPSVFNKVHFVHLASNFYENFSRYSLVISSAPSLSRILTASSALPSKEYADSIDSKKPSCLTISVASDWSEIQPSSSQTFFGLIQKVISPSWSSTANTKSLRISPLSWINYYSLQEWTPLSLFYYLSKTRFLCQARINWGRIKPRFFAIYIATSSIASLELAFPQFKVVFCPLN